MKFSGKRPQNQKMNSRSNEGFIYLQCGKNANVQTVQTSWRPQLPLPTEVRVSDDNPDIIGTNDMERHHHNTSVHHNKKDAASFNGSQISNASSSHPKKWSFGRLFRKKKEIESGSSSEEDRKAGFMSSPKYTRDQKNHNNKSKSKSKNNRGSKLIGAGFDHIVVNPGQQQQQSAQPPPVKRQPQPHRLGNEFFLPFESATNEPFYQNQQQQQQQQLHRHQLHPPIFYQQQYLQNPQQHQPQFSRSSNSLDRRAAAVAPHSSKHQSQSTQRLATADSQLPLHSSSEEELISLNSSTFAKYRSDESIHSGGQGGQNAQSRRSRAARNQRYYKRLSRDGEVSHGQVPIMHAPQPTQRWKTQPVPLSLYSPSTAQSSATQPNQLQSTATQRLQNAGSLQHVTPYVQWGQVQQQPKNLQNSVNASKRSISYDSHIHLQKANGNLQTKPLPPPPPPRDPTRRVNINGSSCELRPLSYAFDTVGVPVFPDAPLNGRCESDDKIWASQTPLYQSAQSLDVNPNHSRQPQTPSQRRFITRSERNAQPGKKSLPNGLDIRYVTDGTPRSRKPIHLLEYQDIDGPPPSSGVLRTTKSGLPSRAPKAVSSNFWKRLDGAQKQCEQDSRWLTGTESAQTPLKPRSASSSRISELRTYPIPMYSEVRKPNRRTQPAAEPQAPPQVELDEVDNVVCGSLHIRPSQDAARTFVEIQNKDVNKSHSMPNYYQHQSSGYASAKSTKYDEYGTEKRERYCNMVPDTPVCPLPNPSTPQTKAYSQPAEPTHFPYKKPNNLEEAITELEAIYKSLKIGDEPVVVRKERVPTPSEFDKFALAHADSYDDDDSPTGDPDPVRDDVAYRNMMLSKLQHKTSEKQPPFGIPVGPIVPSPHNDYLHVTPNTDRKKTIPAPKKVPDIVKDDLAVRALRKDASSCKHEFAYPTGSLQRKNRATRTQSANIYALIQRDAAKPSGGDLFSYMELTKSIDRSGSVSNLQRGDSPADIPSTLQLLRNLKEQDLLQSSSKKAHLPFRHPSQGGAICQLPEKLTSASKEDVGVLCKPVPLPRSSITPESTSASHRLEDALNKIAKDAQDSSAKLSKELQELRKEALITSSRPKMCKEKDSKFEKGLEELEVVSEAAKHCGKMLLNTLPDTTADSQAKSRKLHKEGKLIQAIDKVSEAANAVCEKILKDMVGTESTAVDQDSSKVQKMSTTKPLAMPNLMKNLAPVKSEQIEAIAERCMRQINELTEMPNCENPAEHCADLKAACNDANAQRSASSTKVDANLLSTVAEKAVSRRAKRSKQIEEIDRIMQECEARVRSDDGDAPTVTTTSGSEHLTTDRTTASSLTSSCGNSSHSAQRNAVPNTSASSFSSSSDNLAKSSNSSAVQRQSSSITSFNPYSSSDYIKSPSSEYHAPSTDPIKTFSTTSYDVQSTSITPNMNTSTFSYSPSPPLNLTPVAGVSGEPGSASNREKSSSPSQYNSSEELAMIFGIEERPKQQQQQQKPQQGHNLQQLVHAGNVGPNAYMSSTSSNHASPFACNSPEAHKLTNPQAACNNVKFLNVDVATTSTTATTSTKTRTSPPTNVNNSPSSCKLDTIPEIVLSGQEGQEDSNSEDVLKLSPNFNRIFASKIRIVVDKVADEHAELASSSCARNMTKLDSLTSLEEEEETSSNPDSGNVSLTDFPLSACSTNACLQLQTVYNSRFEVRNSFLNEVRIEHEPLLTSAHKEVGGPYRSTEDEFPRLPTEKEFSESLREGESIIIVKQELKEELKDGHKCLVGVDPELNVDLDDKRKSFIEVELDVKQGDVLKDEGKRLHELDLSEKGKGFIEVEFDKELNEELEIKSKSLVGVEDEELSKVQKDEGRGLIEIKLDAEPHKELDDEGKELFEVEMEKEPYEEWEDEKKGLTEVELPGEFNEVVQDEAKGLNEIELDEILNESITMEEQKDCEASGAVRRDEPTGQLEFQFQEFSKQPEQTEGTNEDFKSSMPERRTSIVYETPQIRMKISEIRLTYEGNETSDDVVVDAQSDSSLVRSNRPEPFLQTAACTTALEELNEALTEMPRQRIINQQDCDDNTQPRQETQLSLVPWLPQTDSLRSRLPRNQLSYDEKPSTSSNALTVLGEERRANSLTVLEQILVASSLGLLTSDDLFTLFLIIVAVITIFAIVLV